MQSMLNICASTTATHGLPLCLSGIIHPLPLSHEMADHDRRRQAMRKKQRSVGRGREGIIHANQEMVSQIEFARLYFAEVKGVTDLNDILHDLSQTSTARAA